MKAAVRAGVLAAVISGVPSTLHALLTGRDPLAATRAAGALSGKPGIAAGATAHVVVSAWWTLVLAAVHRRRPLGAASGAVAGLLIAALDLGVLAPPEIRALPQWPQWLDHALFGAVVGTTLRRAR